MLKRAMLTVSIGLTLATTSYAQPPQTRITGTSKTAALYENQNTGPMRTTLTRENKFPDTGQAEVGGFFSHNKVNDDLERNTYGVYGRYGLSEFVTVEADVPIADADYYGDSNTGLGDMQLRLDLLAYQDIFEYPFIIPHVDVSFPTGDEDKGLGTGETIVTPAISIGTKVYEVLTYVLDVAYSFDGGGPNAENNDIYFVSGSIVWDVSDRLALLAEGRFYEQNVYDNTPYQYKGGFAYRFTPAVQLAVYGGTFSDETDMTDEDSNNEIVDVKVSVQF